MPLPRFEKLPAEKRERILVAAAEEFGTHGYDKASLNQILEKADISKGAAYYYFSDKADLIATVVRHYWLQVADELDALLEHLTPEDFWQRITDLYLHPFEDLERRPWLLGLGRAVWELPHELLECGPLKEVFDDATRWVAALVHRGVESGALRCDLPEPLLIQLLMTMDSLHDRWLGARWQEMDADERARFTATFVSLLRRMLEPDGSADTTEGRGR
jgi:AcrR family transcriptional regulator